MADLDTGKLLVRGSSVISGQLFESSFAEGSERSIRLGGINNLQHIADDTMPSKLPRPMAKPGSVKKRGRPRKPRSVATITGVATKSSRRTSRKFEGDSSGPDDSKTLRNREQNRIAADKCRSRRRQEEAKLKSRHDDLEQKHRSLLHRQSDLMGEIYILKTLMMEHDSCACRLIQDYLRSSASEWVAKKVEAVTSPVDTSPLCSERCENGMASETQTSKSPRIV